MRFTNPSRILIATVAVWIGLAPGAYPQAKKAGKAAAKPGAAKAAAAKPAERPPAPTRRDPFQPLIGVQAPGTPQEPKALPPGKAGLMVSALRVDGIVRAPSGMIAVVSTPQQRVYFLRAGDRLYDGSVERITMDAVVLRETSKDAFGKPLERIVAKRLYPSAGEQ